MSGEEVTLNNSSKLPSHMSYETMGSSKKVLVTFCVGSKKNDDAPLICLDKSLWSQEISSLQIGARIYVALQNFYIVSVQSYCLLNVSLPAAVVAGLGLLY